MDVDATVPFQKYAQQMAKQRASVKWLLLKAYNNKVPEDLKEPFYRDYSDQEHVKPNVVHGLASAELYCQVLAQLYADPNYHQLSHWGVIQALTRKGVYVAQPKDVALTETVLIQTAPIKMSAHMALMEAMMALWVKEVVTAERVMSALKNCSPPSHTITQTPLSPDHALLLWVNASCQGLTERAHQENHQGIEEEEYIPPVFAPVEELTDLCDGSAIAGLISYYCPSEIHWSEIATPDLHQGTGVNVSDAMYNFQLVLRLCEEVLPYSPCPLSVDDLVYMHGSVRQNVLVFLAEMFYMLEVNPVSCVRIQTGHKNSKAGLVPPQEGRRGKRSNIISPIPDLRSSNSSLGSQQSMSLTDLSSQQQNNYRAVRRQNSLQDRDRKRLSYHEGVRSGNNAVRKNQTSSRELPEEKAEDSESGEFVVHHNRMIPTLSSVSPAVSKEQMHNDTKSQERGEMAPAGKPSLWDQRQSRRSRRNSLSDDSQLTVENFGGSQENLSFIGKNPDKDQVYVSGKLIREETPRHSRDETDLCSSPMRRNEVLDNREIEELESREEFTGGKPIVIFADPNRSEMEDDQLSSRSTNKSTSFAELSKYKEQIGGGINIVYMAHERDLPEMKQLVAPKKQEKKSLSQDSTPRSHATNVITDENTDPEVMASQVNAVRLKLEERRRRIESDKRRMEAALSSQRQKLGKAAFLQAVSKAKGSEMSPPGTDEMLDSVEQDRQPRPFSLKDVHQDMQGVESKWLSQPDQNGLRTPDLENMDLEQYHHSLEQMSTSLSELQGDIHRLSNQQQQIQHLVHGQQSQQQPQQSSQQQFYLHGEQQPPPRRQWGSVIHNNGMSSGEAGGSLSRRATWGQPQPFRPVASQGGPMSLGQPPQYMMSGTEPIGGFNLHGPGPGPQYNIHHHQPPQPGYQNGDLQYNAPPGVYPSMASQPPTAAPFRLHSDGYIMQQPHHQQQLPHQQSTPHHQPTPPQYRSSPRGWSTAVGDANAYSVERSSTPSSGRMPISYREASQERTQSPVRPERTQTPPIHVPLPTPSIDDMEPQNVSFIESHQPEGDEDSSGKLPERFQNLKISSGSRTYRIPKPAEPGSPPRRTPLVRQTFRVPKSQEEKSDAPKPDEEQSPLEPDPDHKTEMLRDGVTSDKGFIITFDDSPKRPKPTLKGGKKGNGARSPKTSASSTPSTARSDAKDPEVQIRDRSPSIPTSVMGYKRPSGPPPSPPRSPPPPPRSSPPLSSPSPGIPSLEIDPNVPLERMQSVEEDPKKAGLGLVIGNELISPDPDALDEMERKKERILKMSMKRQAQQEEAKRKKEREAQRRMEEEQRKQEEKERKKEEKEARRAAILEQFRIKKAIEKAEQEGSQVQLPEGVSMRKYGAVVSGGGPRMGGRTQKPRPKSLHESALSSPGSVAQSRGRRGSATNLAESRLTASKRNDSLSGSNLSLYGRGDGRLSRRGSNASIYSEDEEPPYRRGGLRREGSSGSLAGSGGTGSLPRKGSRLYGEYPLRYGGHRGTAGSSESQSQGRSSLPRRESRTPTGRKSNSLLSLTGDSDSYRYGDTDSGLGRATPPRRGPTPSSPSGPGSLPPGLSARRRTFDDGASDCGSTASSNFDYSGPRLYKQPSGKSNRSIILNAVQHCVFPGAVNAKPKSRVLEEINISDSKHFLILFRDEGCQFRALYAYYPDTEEVIKMYGTGPKQVTDRMFDKFFKYNSGGKCFSKIHTKHLTVTIDAFTIHNSLWSGKRIQLPNKRDMALVV